MKSDVAAPPADTQRFLELLRGCREHHAPAVRQLFDGAGAVRVARAPGRLDVMGGIADYSGSLVLQWPIREATHVALAPEPEPRLHVVSLLENQVRTCHVPLAVLTSSTGPASYEDAARWFAADPARHWAAYVAGAWIVLARERRQPLGGARVLVHSSVPEGKGVSSSAALEAATMRALAASTGLQLNVRELALLCQMVENLVVGAPCGVMDQMAAVGGESGRLMALLCQPAEFLGTVALPEGLAVWGIDSGIRHAVTGADYVSVRVGAFMGYRVLADIVGLRVLPGGCSGHVRIDDPRWSGYLANVGPATFAEHESDIPLRMTGRAFLERYGGTTDPVTTVEPDRTYAIRVPTRHPIHEHVRVTTWFDRLRAIESGVKRPLGETGEELGGLMYESHDSYSACGLGSEGTDRLVDLARTAGPARGIYGAKITGGGSGGTVALLARADAAPIVHEIADAYARETGRSVRVFSGSSSGAAAAGVMTVRL